MGPSEVFCKLTTVKEAKLFCSDDVMNMNLLKVGPK